MYPQKFQSYWYQMLLIEKKYIYEQANLQHLEILHHSFFFLNLYFHSTFLIEYVHVKPFYTWKYFADVIPSFKANFSFWTELLLLLLILYSLSKAI